MRRIYDTTYALTFGIIERQIVDHQYENIVILPGGRNLYKPNWHNTMEEAKDFAIRMIEQREEELRAEQNRLSDLKKGLLDEFSTISTENVGTVPQNREV